MSDAAILLGMEPEGRAYTQSRGFDELDASVPLMAVVGFLAPEGQHLLSTIDAVEQGRGSARGLVFRYRGEGGFESATGKFLLLLDGFPRAFSHIGLINAAGGLATALEQESVGASRTTSSLADVTRADEGGACCLRFALPHQAGRTEKGTRW